MLVAVPMFHANGWGLPFAAPAVGAKLVLPGRHTDGAHLARIIRDEGVTVAAGVPDACGWGCWIISTPCGGDMPSLEAAADRRLDLPRALIRRMEERLQARVQTSWGMTELSPLGTIARPEHCRSDRASGPAADGTRSQAHR